MRRLLEDRLIGGVASGVARRFGFDPSIARIGLLLTTLLSGVGIAVYVLAWLFVPLEGSDKPIAARAVADLRGIALAVALVPALVVVLVVASALGMSWLASLAWPFFVAAGGSVLVWRNVSKEERAVMDRSTGPLAVLGLTKRHARSALVARIAVGSLLAAAGLLALTYGHPALGYARPLGGIVALGAAVVVVFGPWWLSVGRALVDERQARALAEARADIAARLHDSVLQTLALVQREAGDPQRVVQLARAQERELRAWLFDGREPGTSGGDATTVSAAVAAIQRDVESRHGVRVEAVVVGECDLDPALRSLLEAGREATVNAAKWSGAPEVSLFVEVQDEQVSMYVRDRGTGFEESRVAPDRRGIAESIRGRMARHGGTAVVRSAPGEGTEVTLTMGRG